jgi:iron complex outermembrane receptor protein
MAAHHARAAAREDIMNRAQFLRTVLFAGSSLAAVAFSLEARAQDGDQPAATPAAGRDVIVVTAQRREESVDDIPMAIQAFTGEELDRLGISDVRDLSAVAPSFTVSQSYQSVPIYTLRGIGFNTINISSTSTVGSYVDEVAYAYPFMLNGPLYDLQRVEVLKGPQGTLYGRNTTAGLVDFITNRPTDEFEASFTGEVGNYATHNYGGYISGPLSDTLRARLAFRAENSDEGWQESNSRDAKLGDVHRYAGRLLVDWEPTDQLSFEASLSGWKNESDTIAAQGIGFTPNTNPTTGGFGPFNTPGLPAYIAANAPTSGSNADWALATQRGVDIGIGAGLPGDLKEDTKFWAASLEAAYEFSDDLRLVSLTGYQDLERNALSDWSGAPFEILLQRLEGRIKSFSEEVRLEGETNGVQWLVGAYYADDDLQDNNRTLLGQNANVAAIRFNGNLLLATPFNSAGYTPLQMSQSFRTYRDLADITAQTASIFANADWTLSDTLSLTTGIRYTEDEHSYVGCSADFNGSMLPNVNVVNRFLITTIYGVTPAQIGANACNTYDPVANAFRQLSHTLTEDNVSWRVALDWQATNDLLLFASVSEGAKAGNTPVNASNVSFQQDPARQETLLAYEVGAKASITPDFQLNASAFFYDYSDKQLSVYFADPIYTALARLQNVPQSEATGFEADATWHVTDNLTFTGTATFLETKVINYQGTNAAGQPQVYDGVSFPYSPELSVAGTVVYDTPITDTLGLQLALNGRWQDDSAADLGDSPTYVIDAYGLVNASVGIHDLGGAWSASVWARNLTDEYYWTSVASNANVVVRFPGQPLTWGASFTYNF